MLIAAPAARKDCFTILFDFNNSTEVFPTEITVAFLTCFERVRLITDIANCYRSIEFDTITCLV